MAECKHHRVCKKQALDGHDGKCILHSEDFGKDKQKFRAVLEEHIEKHGFTFSEMIVPIELRYNNQKFAELNLSNALFLEPVKFLGCVFEGYVAGMHAAFQDECAFNASELQEGARFRKARFGDHLDFTGATIYRESMFTYSTVEGKAKFSSSTLHVANFDRRTFKGRADFSGVTFEGSYTAFGQTDFEKEASFRGATFKNDVVFGGRFDEDAQFSDADFGELSTFSAEFSGMTYFNRSAFKKQVHFREVQFAKNASFENATLEDDCIFRDVEVKEFSLEEAEVYGDLLFTDTFVPSAGGGFKNASFDNALVEGSLTIEGSSEDDRPFDEGTVSFRSVSQSPDASIRFRYADLSECRFLNTDLRSIDFLGVEWCGQVTEESIIDGEWFSRVGLYDEAGGKSERRSEVRERRPWPGIERLYRQLKLNYENRGDFPRAGDFHIGEKEARRRNPETRWGPWLILTAYRALSKYGERALPTVLWLTGIILASMTGYVFLGAIPGGESAPLSPQSPADWIQGLTISMEATFFPVQSAGFRDVWARILNVVQRILSPPIIALLVLALRQRVKR
ncbi:pentapeptide repeat-containing protein [Salinibacter sp.]|uniref:pentapeptide repeat-containing protein n=1 Tax=Salinibacter sp. TaxID=2065818 RepID=UPI0021E93970|nr:pentapeptide repeat-containing protein [Salinibacter sp.]